MNSSDIEFADSLLISGVPPLEPPSSLVFSSSVCEDRSNGYDFLRVSSRKPQAEKPKAGNLDLGAGTKKLHFEGTAQRGLPVEMWGLVIQKLCPVTFSDIISPSVVLRDIATAQIVCKDFYMAAKDAYMMLGKAVHNNHDFLKRETIKSTHATYVKPLLRISESQDAIPWDKLVANPGDFDQPVIQTAITQLGLPFTGDKGHLITCFLRYFGAPKPCNLPAVVVMAVTLEKRRRVADCRIAGLCPLLLTVRTSECGWKRPSLLTMFKARQLLYPRHLVVPNQAGNCDCGEAAAGKCCHNSCKACCPGPCPRHKMLMRKANAKGDVD